MAVEINLNSAVYETRHARVGLCTLINFVLTTSKEAESITVITHRCTCFVHIYIHMCMCIILYEDVG